LLIGGALVGSVALRTSPGRGSENRGGAGDQYSVVKLNVAVHCASRGPHSLLGKTAALASEADETTEEGRALLASEVCLALLREEASWTGASVVAASFEAPDQAEAALSMHSLQERAKIERETVNRVNGKARSDPRAPEGSLNAIGGPTTAVVTLILGLEGAYSVDAFHGTSPAASKEAVQVLDAPTLRGILSSLAGLSLTDRLQVAEVQWTPEEPWETLLPEDVTRSHPDMTPLA